jgi:hypothetical protein
MAITAPIEVRRSAEKRPGRGLKSRVNGKPKAVARLGGDDLANLPQDLTGDVDLDVLLPVEAGEFVLEGELDAAVSDSVSRGHEPEIGVVVHFCFRNGPEIADHR